jgi:hypothetical protein
MSEEIKTFTDLLGGFAEGIPGLSVTEKRPNPNGKGEKFSIRINDTPILEAMNWREPSPGQNIAEYLPFLRVCYIAPPAVLEKLSLEDCLNVKIEMWDGKND